MATRREIFNQLVTVAGECYPEVEARQIAQMIIISMGGISRNDLLVEPNVELEISDLDNITDTKILPYLKSLVEHILFEYEEICCPGGAFGRLSSA
jgi:hypothetical protein